MNVRLRKEESRHYFDNCSSKLNISSKKIMKGQVIQ